MFNNIHFVVLHHTVEGLATNQGTYYVVFANHCCGSLLSSQQRYFTKCRTSTKYLYFLKVCIILLPKLIELELCVLLYFSIVDY